MNPGLEKVSLPGKLVIVGFGSIGQAVLPLLLRHLDVDSDAVTVLAPHDSGASIAREFGVRFVQQALTLENHRSVLEPLLHRGDFLLNLSVDVASLALIDLCRARGALYLDTCIEPWPGSYTDAAKPPAARTNYALREEVLAYARAHAGGPTAVVTHGANPGLVSAFVKQALVNLAAESGLKVAPTTPADWARLAQQLGIKAIHVAERDTQTTPRRKVRGEFVNTWSVPAFVAEGLQPAELGWGTHERSFPADGGRHATGCGAAIFLERAGAATRVRSWTPLEGAYHGFLITHGESVSIADHLTLRDDAGAVVYRPTVHYAYHPCDDAVLSLFELAGRQWQGPRETRVLRDEIAEGVDEMGVLLMGAPRGVYWYGSRLSIDEARRLAAYNNATSMQVAAGILGGVRWALANPAAGVVEPDDLDHRFVLEVAEPYLGELLGVYGAWTPLADRGWPFAEAVDASDPWQFVNMRVT
jgi:homospermidine synthase